jgi:hypothetical protein
MFTVSSSGVAKVSSARALCGVSLALCLTAASGEPVSSSGWARARPVSSPSSSSEADSAAPTSAYAQLAKEVEEEQQRLDKESYGYFDLKRRAAGEAEQATHKAAYQRLMGYARSLPPGCLRMMRDRQRVAERAPAVSKDPLEAANPTNPLALPATDDRSKFGMLCRPRGAPPDELVAKVMAAEELRRKLADTPVTYFGQRARATLEQQLEAAEEELRLLGVPQAGGQGAPRVKRIERERR